jgi:hypothetical protein
MRIRIKSLSPRSTKWFVCSWTEFFYLAWIYSLLDIKQARDVLHLPFDPKQLNHNHQIITHKSHGAHRIVCIYCEPFVSKRKCEPFVLQPSLLVAWRYHTRQSLINTFCVWFMCWNFGVVKRMVGNVCLCCGKICLDKLPAFTFF